MNLISFLGACLVSSVATFTGINKKAAINTDITKNDEVVSAFKVKFSSFSDFGDTYNPSLTYETKNRFVWIDTNYDSHFVDDLTFVQACNYDTGSYDFNFGIYSEMNTIYSSGQHYVNNLILSFVFSLPNFATRDVNFDFSFNEESEYLQFIQVNGNGFDNYYLYAYYNQNATLDEYNAFKNGYKYAVPSTNVFPYRNGYNLPINLKYSFSTGQVNITDRIDMFVEFKFNVTNNELINSAYSNGFYNGHSEGYNDGITKGYNDGYNTGYNIGKTDGISSANDYSFGSLFGAVADTPVLMIRNLFNFDFFGVNLLTVVLSLFTGVIIFYLLRKLL